MYEIKFDHKHYPEARQWCREQFGHNLIHDDRSFGIGWYHTAKLLDDDVVQDVMVFDRKQDAVLFALRWS